MKRWRNLVFYVVLDVKPHSKKKEKQRGSKDDDASHVVSSLNNINTQLKNVMSMLHQRDSVKTAPGKHAGTCVAEFGLCFMTQYIRNVLQ